MFKKGQEWNKPLTKEMEEFEGETGKNAVFKGSITGSFEYWLYMKEQRKLGLVRTRRTKTQISKITHPKKREVELKVVQFTPDQLLKLTNKHVNKLIIIRDNGKISNVPYKQIKRLIDKMKTTQSNNMKEVYKEDVIKIFDSCKVPYNKKYITTEKVIL